MVKGLEVFREHFRNFADRYVLIGGTACDIAMTGAGLPFRATKDLDIVLFVEALDSAFVRAFWEFVRTGGYEVQEKSTGEMQFYRFQKPKNADYQVKSLKMLRHAPYDCDHRFLCAGSLHFLCLDHISNFQNGNVRLQWPYARTRRCASSQTRHSE